MDNKSQTSAWRDFKNDPPEYILLENGNKHTTWILISTSSGDMAVVIHNIKIRKNAPSYVSWQVSGVSGYEWDFDFEDDIKWWMPLPYPPDSVNEI